MTLRHILKKILKSLGLLKPGNFVMKTCYFLIDMFKAVHDFFTSFKFYLYNEWLTNFPSNHLRIFYLRHALGIGIGRSSFIHMGVWFSGKIQIGNNSVIGRNCVLNGSITIKNNVSITAETYIFTTSHIPDSPIFACFYKEVIINDYAWIGARAMILPGIEIGRGAVVGATATVTKNVSENSIVAGVPAKEIGKRTLIPEFKLEYSPFFQ